MPGPGGGAVPGGFGWPVSSAHRWLFRLSRALDLNLLLIHGSCSPSAAQLKARRRRRMKGGGDQGQLRTDGRVTPEGPHPGSGSGGGDGGKEERGGEIKSPTLQAPAPAASACVLHPGAGRLPRGLPPQRPLPRRGAPPEEAPTARKVSPVTQPLGWGDRANPGKKWGPTGPRRGFGAPRWGIFDFFGFPRRGLSARHRVPPPAPEQPKPASQRQQKAFKIPYARQ